MILPPSEKPPLTEPTPEPAPSPAPVPAPEIEKPTIDELERRIFDLINKKRLENDKPTLSWGKYLHEKARAHSEYLALTRKFEHSDYDYFENIYQGIGISEYRLHESVVGTWMKSPRHKANLLNRELSTGAIGLAFGENRRVYVTFLANW